MQGDSYSGHIDADHRSSGHKINGDRSSGPKMTGIGLVDTKWQVICLVDI